jgi:S1-C subfamily serine protease
LQSPGKRVSGSGVYLGNGLIITAAHVIGWVASLTKGSDVRIAGLDLPATLIKRGSFEQVDLALLTVREDQLPDKMRTLRMRLCEKSSWVGEPVIVALPENTARSRVMTPLWLPRNLQQKYPTVISDVATTGNSGSGVFDAKEKCLLGIVSSKIQARFKWTEAGSELVDIAKYFVPSSTILSFIPPNYRF